MRAYPLTGLTFFVIFFANLRRIYSFDLVNGGHYRIQSMEDGLYVSAAYPSFEEGINLGEITTEKWANSREQRWEVIAFNTARNEYWLFSQENTFNRLSAAASHEVDRPAKHISELIPAHRNKYLIRSIVRDACLVNPGRGLKIIFAICNSSAKNQHWVFDLLAKN